MAQHEPSSLPIIHARGKSVASGSDPTVTVGSENFSLSNRAFNKSVVNKLVGSADHFDAAHFISDSIENRRIYSRLAKKAGNHAAAQYHSDVAAALGAYCNPASLKPLLHRFTGLGEVGRLSDLIEDEAHSYVTANSRYLNDMPDRARQIASSFKHVHGKAIAAKSTDFLNVLFLRAAARQRRIKQSRTFGY